MKDIAAAENGQWNETAMRVMWHFIQFYCTHAVDKWNNEMCRTYTRIEFNFAMLERTSRVTTLKMNCINPEILLFLFLKIDFLSDF